MPEVVGKCACPLCGADAEVKINKNGKLYSFCDYGCAVKLSSAASRAAIKDLLNGKITQQGKITITPLKGTNDNDRNRTTGTTTDGRTEIERRDRNTVESEPGRNESGVRGWSLWE